MVSRPRCLYRLTQEPGGTPCTDCPEDLMATRIILARHGESTVNVIQLASDDHENNPLTELGESQAATLAEQLRGSGASQVYTSPTQRARETGAAVADANGLPIAIEWGIEEIRIGIHEGERGQQSIERGTLDFRRWVAEEDLSHGYEGGEDGFEVAARTQAALERIVARHDGETVVVVSHGGAIIMTVPTICANLRARDLYTRQLPNCGVVELVHDDGAWTCATWLGVAPEDFGTDADDHAHVGGFTQELDESVA